MRLASGEEPSRENISCRSPELGTYLAYLGNKDAFVAGMEWVREERSRRWNQRWLQTRSRRICRSWWSLRLLLLSEMGSSWWTLSKGIYTMYMCSDKISWASAFRGDCKWAMAERGDQWLFKKPRCYMIVALPKVVRSGWIMDDKTYWQDVRWEKLKQNGTKVWGLSSWKHGVTISSRKSWFGEDCQELGLGHALIKMPVRHPSAVSECTLQRSLEE